MGTTTFGEAELDYYWAKSFEAEDLINQMMDDTENMEPGIPYEGEARKKFELIAGFVGMMKKLGLDRTFAKSQDEELDNDFL